MFKQWEGFKGELWKESVDVREFIQKNYSPYEGDDSFLVGMSAKKLLKFGRKLTHL